MRKTLALAALTAGGVAQLAAAQEQTRLNILFCFADDWGRYAGVYAPLDKRPSANDVIQTPHIDRIAREGVIFRNAFVNSPSCTPCRSSLLSGRYFFRTGRGAILQGALWDSAIPSYPLLLRDAGYHIGKSYKVWSPGEPKDAPYGGQRYAYERAGRAFNSFSQTVTRLVRKGMPVDRAKQRIYDEVRGNFEAFLADRPEGKPFCYWFGPTNTHRRYEKGSGKALWGIAPDSLKGRLPAFLPDVAEVREDFADYLGEAQAFDAAVGLLVRMVQEAGELDRTLIVISGDHGAPGFPHGKCNLYGFGVGVSLIARWPKAPGGRVVDDFTVLMDLAPTFLEAGGLTPPVGMDGRSLVNVLTSDKSGLVDPSRTWVITGRERHVAAAREGNLPYPHRALHTRDFLYIRNFEPDRWPMGDPKLPGLEPLPADQAPASGPSQTPDDSLPSAEVLEKNTFIAFADMDASPTKAWLIEHRGDPAWREHYDYAFGRRPSEELYDLTKDPDQIKNVAADPKYADARRRLAEQLMGTLRRAGDPRVTGDGRTYDRPPFAGPDNAPPTSRRPEKAKAPSHG